MGVVIGGFAADHNTQNIMIDKELKNMNEQFGSMNRCEAYRPHAGRFLPLVIPLAIGLILGMRKGMMHHMRGPGKRWESGVPPFFAELHRRAHEATDQPAQTEA